MYILSDAEEFLYFALALKRSIGSDVVPAAIAIAAQSNWQAECLPHQSLDCLW